MKHLFFILSLLCVAFISNSQISYHIGANKATTSILIKFPSGSNGSGFILQDSQYLYVVTARHVLFGGPNGSILRGDSMEIINYTQNVSEDNMTRLSLGLKNANDQHVVFSDPSSDVAIVPIGIVSKASIGYFSFLLIEGVVAGKNDLTKRIILNAQVYHGNSGGPVFIQYLPQDPIKLIGIVTDLIPYTSEIYKVHGRYLDQHSDSTQTVFTNSNFSVISPIDNILPLIEQFKRRSQP